jgi:hypothetical protein
MVFYFISTLLKGNFFETGCHYVAQDGLELEILLPWLPEYWDYKCTPPCLIINGTFIMLSYTSTLHYSHRDRYYCSHFINK